MADSLRPVVKMLIHRLEITRGYLLPGYSEADQEAQAAIAFAEAALAAEPHAPAPVLPLDLDALLSPEGAYEPGTGQEDGAQLVDQVQWWAPLHGCDTLENLLNRIRGRILPHLRPPIAGIDVPGPDGDYGGLQELCDAEGVDVRIGAPLLKRAREAWGATQPPAPGPAAGGDRDHVPGAVNMVAVVSAVSYDVGGLVQIQQANQHPEAWAIRCNAHCMSTTGKWNFEPMPSDRTDEWLATHRWPSATDALVFLLRLQEVEDD